VLHPGTLCLKAVCRLPFNTNHMRVCASLEQKPGRLVAGAPRAGSVTGAARGSRWPCRGLPAPFPPSPGGVDPADLCELAMVVMAMVLAASPLPGRQWALGATQRQSPQRQCMSQSLERPPQVGGGGGGEDGRKREWGNPVPPETWWSRPLGGVYWTFSPPWDKKTKHLALFS